MDLGLTGKAAIVTGGSAGIGLACATALHSEGVSVAIVARTSDRLHESARSIGAGLNAGPEAGVIPISGDVSRADDVSRIVSTARERLGRIDILVNCAGAARAGAFLDLGDDAYLDAWMLKVLGYIRMVRAVVPAMIEQRDGRIVNIVGAAGRTPESTFLAGSTANAALLNFTRGVSKVLARHNIRINAISPGFTATQRAERLAAQHAAANGTTVDEARTQMAKAIPLGHLVDPAEIAAVALLVVSDRVPSMTGAEILIDGGQTPGV
jgi:3-oxoacyl-[acyl-carrier protein] reductase/bacilysin biosynthesis oxidoreductase BacG